MDNIEYYDLFYDEKSLNMKELKKNFNILKETFSEELIQPIEFNEDFTNLDVNKSVLGRRSYGIVRLYIKDNEYNFKTTNIIKEVKWDEWKEVVAIWEHSDSTTAISIIYTLFSEFDIICIPKVSRHPNWMVSSVKELLRFYDLYRKVPNVILYHDKHGKKFTENSYLKLELIK
jgi:predicted nucleic acid-binding protein